MRCGRVSRRCGDPDELLHGWHGDGLRMRVIVPAPNVAISGKGRCDRSMSGDRREFGARGGGGASPWVLLSQESRQRPGVDRCASVLHGSKRCVRALATSPTGAATVELRHSPCERLSLSRRVLLDLKVGTVRAAMATVSPVRGFLPWRAARWWAVNLPKLARLTASPLSSASAMAETRASSAVAASARDNDGRAAVRAPSAVRFTASLRCAFGRRCSNDGCGVVEGPRRGAAQGGRRRRCAGYAFGHRRSEGAARRPALLQRIGRAGDGGWSVRVRASCNIRGGGAGGGVGRMTTTVEGGGGERAWW